MMGLHSIASFDQLGVREEPQTTASFSFSTFWAVDWKVKSRRSLLLWVSSIDIVRKPKVSYHPFNLIFPTWVKNGDSLRKPIRDKESIHSRLSDAIIIQQSGYRAIYQAYLDRCGDDLEDLHPHCRRLDTTGIPVINWSDRSRRCYCERQSRSGAREEYHSCYGLLTNIWLAQSGKMIGKPAQGQSLHQWNGQGRKRSCQLPILGGSKFCKTPDTGHETTCQGQCLLSEGKLSETESENSRSANLGCLCQGHRSEPKHGAMSPTETDRGD